MAEVRENLGVLDAGHEAATGKEVVDAVAHLLVSPCAIIGRFLFCGMKQAEWVHEVTFRQ